MDRARVVKHTISLEYKCPENGATHSVKIVDPRIGQGNYFSDWTYDYIEFNCKFCGKTHRFEI